MRGILISLGIIFFCLSVEIIYGLDDAVYAESGNRLLTQRLENTPLNRNNIPNINLNRDGLNQTVSDLSTPMQQQVGVTDVMGYFGFMFGGLLFILNTLIYSTVGFYWWSQANLLVPSYLALTFQAFILLAHSLTILQWVSGKDIRGGG